MADAYMSTEPLATRVKRNDDLDVTEHRITDDKCEKDCGLCINQFIPGKIFHDAAKIEQARVTDAQASFRGKQLKNAITGNLTELQERLRLYGDAVAARWRKMPQAKREAALLSARPEMYTQKWPEIRGPYGLDKASQHTTTDMRGLTRICSEVPHEAVLLPYLNVENLVEEPRKLLSLLRCRSGSQPQDWVYFDSLQFRRAWQQAGFPLEYNEKCLVMYGKNYGKLVSWDREKCHASIYIGFPVARWILYAQAHIYSFCNDIVKVILNSGEPGLGNSTWSSLMKTGFQSGGMTLSVCGNLPYIMPLKFNPHHALATARAHLEASLDHLRSLQTDPTYFHFAFASRKAQYQHRVESSAVMWQHFGVEILHDSIKGVRGFRILTDLLEHNVRVYEKVKDSIGDDGCLPKEYAVAVADLRWFCLNHWKWYSDMLHTILSLHSGFSRNYDYTPREDGRVNWDLKFEEPGRNFEGALYMNDPLHWALYELGVPMGQLWTREKSSIMIFLEDYLAQAAKQGHRKEMARIDQTLQDYLALYTCFYEIYTATQSVHTSVTKYNDGHPYTVDDERRLFVRWGKIGLRMNTIGEANQLADVAKDFYGTPLPKGRRDEKWLESKDLLRQRQAKVWQVARTILAKQLKDSGCRQEDIDYEIMLLSQDSTEEHLAEVKAEKQTVLDKLDRKVSGQPDTSIPVQTQWGDTAIDKLVLPTERIKLKTRPEEAGEEVQTPVNAPAVQPPPPPPSPQIEVTADTLRTLSKLFRSSNDVEHAQGMVKWHSMVSAMADIGFSAHHCGGSAVRFDKSDRSFMVHKPHPDPEVGPEIYREWGKRLHRKFGWTSETFVKREKVNGS